MRVLFTGGGTGGHITPIVAVAREIKKIYSPEIEINPKDKELKLYFLGAKAPVNLIGDLEQEGIKIKFVAAGKFRRYLSPKILIDLFKIPIGLCQSLWYLFIWMPDVIFNKGGYGSLPAIFVGWLYCIPILTHESDAVPGLATRLGGKFSRRIAFSFDQTGKFFPDRKSALTGNPIRRELVADIAAVGETEQKAAKDVFQIASSNPVILILGGSQGAKPIDEVVLAILPQIFGKYEIIHQCRGEDYNNIKQQTDEAENYHLYPFLNESQLRAAFLLADLVVSRAGATSIFEIAACGKPSILIPLPDSASDHQRENAFTYAKAGATVVVEQINLTPNILLSGIEKIINEAKLSRQMSQNAKNFAILEAGEKIAEEIIKLGLK